MHTTNENNLYTAENNHVKISMLMLYTCKCSNRRKLLFDHLLVRFNVVFLCKIGLKCQYASRAVCAYVHIFQKIPGCALIAACVLIGTNTVSKYWYTYTLKHVKFVYFDRAFDNIFVAVSSKIFRAFDISILAFLKG